MTKSSTIFRAISAAAEPIRRYWMRSERWHPPDLCRAPSRHRHDVGAGRRTRDQRAGGGRSAWAVVPPAQPPAVEHAFGVQPGLAVRRLRDLRAHSHRRSRAAAVTEPERASLPALLRWRG